MDYRFLIIGSNSFSGSSMVRYLLGHGHDVLGVSRSDQPHDVFLPYKWTIEGQNRFCFEKIDLNHDLNLLMELILTHKPEYIINFAAQGMVGQSWQIPEHWYQTNVLAQVKLHDQLRKIEFLKKYVHVTTPEVYGNTNGWIKENFNFNPSTPYAVSRAACDLHLMSFFKAYKFPVVFTRAANVYGPGQPLYRIIPRSFFFAKTGQKLELHGGGHSVRSFIHIQDVADATYKIALKGIPGTAYHLSTQSSLSIRDLVKKISKMCNMDFQELVQTSQDRLGKDHAYFLDSSRVREELNWSDRIGLEQGLEETFSWIENNLETLLNESHEYQHKP